MKMTKWAYSSLFTLGMIGAAPFAYADGFKPVAYENEATIKEQFKKTFNGMPIDAVVTTPFEQLLEVQVDGQILYTNPEFTFIIQGGVVDVATRTDLTANRLAEINRVDVSSIDLNNAIKTVKGDGSRTLIAFEDPNCIYCKRFHEGLEEIDNVTVYSLLYPILSEDSKEKSENIWCASNQVKAWSDWMRNGVEPDKISCDTPIEANLALGQKLNITGTPAFVFADGMLATGLMPMEQLEKQLTRSAERVASSNKEEADKTADAEPSDKAPVN